MANCAKEIGIAGNAGLVRAAIRLYDHYPFWARPYQIFTFPFTQTAGAEVAQLFPGNTDVDFAFGNAILAHFTDKKWSNFIAVEKDGKMDISRGLKSTPDVITLLPGGKRYNESKNSSSPINKTKDYEQFKHFLWIQEPSSAFYETTVLAPSDYSTPASVLDQLGLTELTGLTTLNDFLNKQRFSISAGTATWDMISETDTSKDINYVYPMMVGRKACSDLTPIHWTIRKHTPLFQGEDFSIEFIIPDKVTNDFKMRATTAFEELTDNRMRGDYAAFFDPLPGIIDANVTAKYQPWYEKGVSNPFSPTVGPNDYTSDPSSTVNSFISQYYLKNKAYIIIELGNESSRNFIGATNRTANITEAVGHNYFIMLVRGQNPMFLHWGMEIRGFDGAGQFGTGSAQDPLSKLRVLSVFENVSVDDLFKKGRFKITIQNILGDLVVSFSDVQIPPWKISRTDLFMENGEPIPSRVPMVVENGPIRIHGGNMTTGFSFGPLVYSGSGSVLFRDRQADIYNTTNNDIYATFAHPGDNTPSSPYSSYGTRSKRAGLFKDQQFEHLKMGYDADAHTITEIHQNSIKTVQVYRTFRDNYVLYGREYARTRPGTNENLLYDGEQTSTLNIEVIKTTSVDDVVNISYSHKLGLSGLPESYMGSDGKYIGQWNMTVTLEAGSVRLPTNHKPPIEEIDYITGEVLCPDDTPAIIKNCVTPIATAWNLIVLGGGKVVTSDMTEDISEFVSSINDGWQAEGYNSINHETKLKLYLPTNVSQKEIKDKISRILSLMDKTFYITISYWWENGIGLYYSIQDTNLYNPKRPKPGDDDNPRLIQMTGICYGADINRTANVVEMSLTVKDYMEPLKQQPVFNCPFFDSVSDISAVLELARIAQFDNTYTNSSLPGQQNKEGIDRRPLGFLQKLQKTTTSSLSKPLIYNEEKHVHVQFALPGSYASLNNPVMRFGNGTPIKEIIDRFMKMSGKVCYFDRYGVMIVEMSPAYLSVFNRTKVDSTDPDSPLFDIDIQKLIKASFCTTPRGTIWDVGSRKMVDFDPQKHTPFLVYKEVKVKRSVSEAINQLLMWSALAPDPDNPKKQGFISKGRTFYDQIWNPEAEGFFGYRKMFWQSNGIFGDEKSTNSAMEQYSRFKFPPLNVTFECFGLPGLKPLDVIMLDSQPLYINDINHELDPKTNSWWMTINGEWFKSYDEKMLLPPTTTTDITRPDQ